MRHSQRFSLFWGARTWLVLNPQIFPIQEDILSQKWTGLRTALDARPLVHALMLKYQLTNAIRIARHTYEAQSFINLKVYVQWKAIFQRPCLIFNWEEKGRRIHISLPYFTAASKIFRFKSRFEFKTSKIVRGNWFKFGFWCSHQIRFPSNSGLDFC